MKARPFPGLSTVLRDLPDDRKGGDDRRDFALGASCAAPNAEPNAEVAKPPAGARAEPAQAPPVSPHPSPSQPPSQSSSRGRAPAGSEKRIHTRFDKAFLVVIGSELFGDTHAIARNISTGGILVEMSYAPPLGSQVTVHFRNLHEDGRLDEIVARAEVKHHHYLNFTGGRESDSARAVGLRFFEFLDSSASDSANSADGKSDTATARAVLH
ncbi:MAG TPA: PilZ domain-containing protein [Kofleriaceae bacterium]|nr:PilZ domain-containing protein [Kofleriaceae bacterium]